MNKVLVSLVAAAAAGIYAMTLDTGMTNSIIFGLLIGFIAWCFLSVIDAWLHTPVTREQHEAAMDKIDQIGNRVADNATPGAMLLLALFIGLVLAVIGAAGALFLSNVFRAGG